MQRAIILIIITILAHVGVAQAQVSSGVADGEPSIEQAMWQWSDQSEGGEFAMLSAYESNLLQATTFGLGFARYRTRGYPWRTADSRLGGLAMRDIYRDIPAWGALTGLSQIGTKRNNLYLSSIGSTTDRDIAAHLLERGGKVSLSTSNRASYLARVTASYSSGESSKGWAYSLYASHSGGRAWAMDGVWNNNWALYASVSKRIGVAHHISVSFMAAPNERSTRSASTDEAYALTGNNLYNPAWGMWSGKQRSARVQSNVQPIAMLNHNYKTDVLEINTTLSARVGSESRSDLNWQNAPNPRPDYYRYMPSFQGDDRLRKEITKLWHDDDRSVTQIDFEQLVRLNRYNNPRAHYIIESRHRAVRQAIVQSTLAYRHNESSLLTAGVEASYNDELNFKRLDDLLGAEYWLDIDAFAEGEEDTQGKTQNNLRDPNRRVKVGDDFGYRYTIESLRPRAWVNLAHRYKRWDFELGASVGAWSYRRVGHYEKENFSAEQSYGSSERALFVEWLTRAGVGYSLGGRFRAGLSVAAQELAPTPGNAFVDIDYRNAMLPDLRNEQILSAEATLDYRLPWLRLYGAAFYTRFANRSEMRHFYDDFNHYFCNYSIVGIDTRHAGVELSAEVELVPRLWLRMSGVLSDNRYTSNPTARQERQSVADHQSFETVYLSSLRVEGSPQCIGVAEIEYSPNQWMFSLALNAFSHSYIAPTPLRRTLRAAYQASSPEQLDELVGQEQFAGGATLDLFVGRTVYLRGNQRMGFYLGANNLLNKRDMKTGGYESSRVRQVGSEPNRKLRPLDSKYYYAQGFNFYFTATYRF